MPGIVGIVSERAAHECENLVQQMVGSMLHEPFYVSGTCSAPDLGVYAGWVAHDGSFAARECEANETNKEAALAFSGECYHDDGLSLLDLYARQHESFIAKLNGLFSGLLIDYAGNAAFLFTDRYGFDRVYIAEVDDELYFASEAKALLAVLPESRAFDHDGVADFVAFGCTIGNRTLFKGISLLPQASLWVVKDGKVSKRRYFNVDDWERQDPLAPAQFGQALEEAVENNVPKYFAAPVGKLGISLTAGLDSRLLLAARPLPGNTPICYTYDGVTGETLDARLAAKVAAAAGYPHEVVRLGSDFFTEFTALAERIVYLTDGAFGPTGAHELYLSSAARALAPVRLTGVFGGEIFRGVSTFNPLGLNNHLLEPSLAEKVRLRIQPFPICDDQPVTRAAFKEIPWGIFGSVAACRSQLSFRTPYMDNELVSLAYRMPGALRRSPSIFEALVRKKAPALARIPTDMGSLVDDSHLKRLTRKTLAKITFKLDQLFNDGMPHWFAGAEPSLQTASSRLGLLGRHKYLSYRRWFRWELADYVREALGTSSLRRNPLWKEAFVNQLAERHISGSANFLQEINTVLTLDIVERCFFTAAKANEPRPAASCRKRVCR